MKASLLKFYCGGLEFNTLLDLLIPTCISIAHRQLTLYHNLKSIAISFVLFCFLTVMYKLAWHRF